ncbi:MAG: porin family protein [Desulfovibrionaceae bacterium]|nr:porin family protein [Desulfovibrionaceae bacterium]
MKYFCCLAALFIVCASVSAHAGDSGVYVAPKFLYSNQNSSGRVITNSTGADVDFDDQSEDTFGGALALGYDFQPRLDIPIRAELEYAYRAPFKVTDEPGAGFDYDSEFEDFHTLFLNVFLDIRTGTPFTPYVGGGVGMATLRSWMQWTGPGTNLVGSKKTTTNLAWNLGAGIAYGLTDDWSLDLGYRYSDFGRVESGTIAGVYANESHLTAHEMLLGVRYSF